MELWQFGSLLDNRLLMRKPVTVPVSEDGPYWVAAWDEVNDYGIGDSPASAINDLRVSVAGLYWGLRDAHNLGTDLLQTWAVLAEYVYEKDPGVYSDSSELPAQLPPDTVTDA